MDRPDARRVVKAPKSLLDGLGERPIVAVDTAPIIYWLEGRPRFADRFATVFSAVESGAATIVISTVTLAEVLAGPLRAGNELLTGQYREALTRGSDPRGRRGAGDARSCVEESARTEGAGA
jgi:hypothetical protein